MDEPLDEMTAQISRRLAYHLHGHIMPDGYSITKKM
jgi:hypothetical protein